jgi:hypothetical protein
MVAEGIPLHDMVPLSQRLRYQASRLGFRIHIQSDAENGRMAFRCEQVPDE